MSAEGLEFPGFSPEERENIKLVITDVDDTITTGGKLYPDTLSCLWRLKRSGRMVVLLTGGSAGWADVYIRQWPVDAVIAESGAMILAHKTGGDIFYTYNPAIDSEARRKKDALLKLTAGLTLSSDQYARIYDVAYDKSRLDRAERHTLLQLIKARAEQPLKAPYI